MATTPLGHDDAVDPEGGGFDLDLRMGELSDRGPAPDGADPTADTRAGDSVDDTAGPGCDTSATCGGPDCVVQTVEGETCAGACGVTDDTCAAGCLVTSNGDTCVDACFTGDTCPAGTCDMTCLPESCELVQPE
jgi:hypothetical protein